MLAASAFLMFVRTSLAHTQELCASSTVLVLDSERQRIPPMTCVQHSGSVD